MKTCIDFIIENNCPDPMICGINCASQESVELDSVKIIPFNNYGQYYLRIKSCVYKTHPNKLERYSTIDQVACTNLEEFQSCSRFIPPSSFVPVALPIDTTYVEIDSCVVDSNNTYTCLSNPAPVRVYGNERLFPRSFDTEQTSLSVCSSNGTWNTIVYTL